MSRPVPTGLDWDAITTQYVARGGELHPEVWSGANKAVQPAKARNSTPRPARDSRLRSAASTSNNPLGRGAVVDLNREQLADIIARYKEGEGAPPIARTYGIASNTVIRLLRDAGVPIRAKGCPVNIPQEIIGALVDRYYAGETVDEIAKAENLGRRSLSRAFHNAGVTMRGPSEARKLAGQRKKQLQ